MVIFSVHPAEPQGTVTASSLATAVVVIPVRYRSTRFPGKALEKISGRPMVEHVYNRAIAASSITSVIVATDDKRIYRAVRAFGGNVRMTHKHHQSGMDRLSEIAPNLSCDFIVNVQGDEPLIEPDAIDLVLKVLTEEPETKMSTVCCPITTTEELLDPARP